MFRRIEVDDVAERNHGELEEHDGGKDRELFEDSYTVVMEWYVSGLIEDCAFDTTYDGGTKTRKRGFGVLEGVVVCAGGSSGGHLSIRD